MASSLLDRFPALSRLSDGARRRKIPWIPQTASTDCGAACLTMVLAYFGKEIELEEVRSYAYEGRDGTSARFLLESGRELGLRGRAVSVQDVKDLRLLPPGTILHWSFSHFVVLEKVTRRGVVLVDPAGGRGLKSWEHMSQHFTGVAITFEPGADFEPERSRSSVGTARFAAELLGRSGSLFRVLSTSVFLQLLALGLPILTGLVVDRVVPHHDWDLLHILLAGFAGLIGFRFIASLVRSLLLVQLKTDLDAKITLEFLDHLVDLPYSFFQVRSTGDLMMRLNSNSTVREMFTGAALSAILDGSTAFLYLAVLFLASPPLGALVLLLAAARFVVFIVARRKFRERMTLVLERQARSRTYQVQLLSGIETLKTTGSEKRAVERWSHLFADELNATASQGRLNAWSDSLLEALTSGSPLIVLLAGCAFVLQGDLSLGTMLALNAIAIGFLTPLSTLISTALQFETLKSYIARIDDVLASEKEQKPGIQRLRPDLSGSIRLESVSFRYGVRGPYAISDVSLSIEPGEMVALVGASGAGKTTLANLLLGLYRPSEGRVSFDSYDLEELDLVWLRKRFGVVSQSPYLFGSTVRDNIALSDPTLTLEQVAEAARLAQIHDEIAAMPMGYGTELGQGGNSISGGQRQRIALARALVHRPSILLLDEATSNLDAITERKIHQELERLACTRIVIAHRLSTIRAADKIVVVEGGTVVESGSYGELLRKGAAFARLIEAQQDSRPAPREDRPFEAAQAG